MMNLSEYMSKIGRKGGKVMTDKRREALKKNLARAMERKRELGLIKSKTISRKKLNV